MTDEQRRQRRIVAVIPIALLAVISTDHLPFWQALFASMALTAVASSIVALWFRSRDRRRPPTETAGH